MCVKILFIICLVITCTHLICCRLQTRIKEAFSSEAVPLIGMVIARNFRVSSNRNVMSTRIGMTSCSLLVMSFWNCRSYLVSTLSLTQSLHFTIPHSYTELLLNIVLWFLVCYHVDWYEERFLLTFSVGIGHPL